MQRSATNKWYFLTFCQRRVLPRAKTLLDSVGKFQFLANLCYSPNWSLGNIKDIGVILSPLAFCEGNFLTSWIVNVTLFTLVLFQVLACGLVQVFFQVLVEGLVKFSAPKADQCSWYWSRPTAEKRFINLLKWRGSKLSAWQFWTEIEFKSKHCQRHNGPEGWVHLAKVISQVQTQILIEFHLQNLD